MSRHCLIVASLVLFLFFLFGWATEGKAPDTISNMSGYIDRNDPLDFGDE